MYTLTEQQVKDLIQALKPLAELDLTGVTGGGSYQMIRVLDVLAARKAILETNLRLKGEKEDNVDNVVYCANCGLGFSSCDCGNWEPIYSQEIKP